MRALEVLEIHTHLLEAVGNLPLQLAETATRVGDTLELLKRMEFARKGD